MSLPAGAKLGRYEVIGPLGAGGMGEVYRARDTRLDRTIAIKILPAQFSSDPVHKQRFEREAKTISNLNHPHICVLYDVGHQDGIDYLVMECVEGETLAQRLEKGPMPLEQVLKYGAQIADALDEAHQAGIVHRDLKPGNIMLTVTGAKLLDFGLAKPAAPVVSEATLTAAATQATPVTQEGTIVGTFRYMSPEQVEGKEVDSRSDIFSLGAVLYEMVTGRRAFEGKSQLNVASAILEEEPPISALRPITPRALHRAVEKCLAKIPNERWQCASDLASELKWIGESGVQTVGAALVGETTKSRLDHCRRIRDCPDRFRDLVAKLSAAARNDVFSCSPVVSCAGYRRRSKRAHDCSSRILGVRAKECSLDLRAGVARGKEPRRYRGRKLSVLVARWTGCSVLC